MHLPQSTPEQINEVLFIIKAAISSKHFHFIQNRKKNMETLAALGFVTQNVFEIIYHLSYRNYLNGPVRDRDFPSEQDSIWEFAYELSDPLRKNCCIYIKIKVKCSNDVVGISFHIAEKPCEFHYK